MQGEGLTVGLLDWVDPTREWFKSRPEAARGLLGAAYQMATDPNARKEAMDRQPAPFQRESGQAMFSRAMDVGPQGLLGKIVYHGSPHKFDKFDASKIGTGEGAQAYGHGVYMADAPDVASGYAGMRPAAGKSTLNGADWDASTYAEMLGEARARGAGSYEKGIASLQKDLDKALAAREINVAENFQDAISALSKMRSRGVELNTGQNLYKADLPDEWIPKMLDWDKPLKDQPESTRNIVKTLVKKAEQDAANPNAMQGMATWSDRTARRVSPEMVDKMDGAAIHEMLQKVYGNSVSQEFNALGIPGIRYLDGGSRGAGQGSYNYVVFPGLEDQVKILERNGMPINGLLGR